MHRLLVKLFLLLSLIYQLTKGGGNSYRINPTSDDYEEDNYDAQESDREENEEAGEDEDSEFEESEPTVTELDEENDDDSNEDVAKSGYGYSSQRRYAKPKVKKVFVPVYVPDKEKKKMKILSVDKGSYIPGGSQLPGKFKSLKLCMKACALSPICFAGDYNPWLHKCYQHSNLTGCNKLFSHPQFVHFSKVPCSITDAPTGTITLGASVQNGIEQKGIENLQQCLKKCSIAGGGIQPTVGLNFLNNATNMNVLFANAILQGFGNQACFAIDYDFTTHKCFFFGNNVVTTVTQNATFFDVIQFQFLHCVANKTPMQFTVQPPSLNLMPNPSTVHITLCPYPL